jgi:hypothetical protein
MNGLHEAFDELVADVPVYGDLDRAIEQAEHERRHRYGMVAGLAAAAAVVAVIVGVLVVTRADDAAPEPAVPSPTPTSTQEDATDPAQKGQTIPRGPSEVLAVRQLGGHRLEVAGEIIPGAWELTASRGDVWVGLTTDGEWWGKGTTTRQMPNAAGGIVISQDAHWIVWTRITADIPGGNPPRVMEVVDTATGEVQWSRSADADATDLGALAVTNDGVVVLAHCTETAFDIGGYSYCDDARVDVWEPRSGVTNTVPAEVTVEHGPPGSHADLNPLVQVTGEHNGLLVRSTTSGRPQYVRVSEHADVEAVAILPRRTQLVTADERFALLECPGCGLTVLSLDSGELRPITAPAGLNLFEESPEFYPYVVERDDLVLVLQPGADARCSLAQARCVRIKK